MTKWLIRLLKLRKQLLTRSPDSVSTPYGYIPWRYCRVKSQPWRPIVHARWYDEREKA